MGLCVDIPAVGSRRGLRSAVIAGACLVLAGCVDPDNPADHRFDLNILGAPAGTVCTASNPGGKAEVTRDLMGRPYVKLMGHAQQGTINCRMPDGASYTVVANKMANAYRMNPEILVTARYRAGADVLSGSLQTRNGMYRSDTAVPAMIRDK